MNDALDCHGSSVAAHRHGLHEGVIVKVNALSSASDVVVVEEEEGVADGQPAYHDTPPVADGSAAVRWTPS